MTITKEALEQAVQPVDGRVPTLREAGQSLGVTRERIRQLLRQHRIKKQDARRGSIRRYFCAQCFRPLLSSRQPRQGRISPFSGYCYECKPRRPRKYAGTGTVPQRRRLLGLCWHCASPAVAGRAQCQKHLDIMRAAARQYQAQKSTRQARLLRISQLAHEILQLLAQEGQS